MKIVRINAMWCAGCIAMHKIWLEIEKMYPNIEFISYDYDMDEEIVKEYKPGKILPVTIIFKNDIELLRLNGEKTVKEIDAAINSIEVEK